MKISNSAASPPLKPVKISLTKEEIIALERMQKEESRRRFKIAKVWFSQAFPKAFNIKEPIPLKVDIHKDIIALEAPFSRTLRINVLKWYLYSPGYMKAVMEGDWRHDLNGEPVEQISPEQKTYALQQLEFRKSRWKDNKRAIS